MRPTTAVATLLLLLVVGPPRSARAQIEAEQVRQAIDRGVAYLEREQRDDGSWPEFAGYQGGVTGLCALALVNCGESPDEGQVRAALDHLRRLPPATTYATALQTMVFCAAEPKTSQALVRRNVAWFIQTQKREGERKGAWGYPAADGDNSNSQFALLALHEAERIGVEVNNQTWRLALDYWKRSQNVDGSWGYVPQAGGTGSMTCAGIAAMIITSDKLNRGDATVEGGRVKCCGEQEDNSEIDRGLDWLGRNFTVHTNPGSNPGQPWLLYYLYGVERVGRLTNQRFIGQHDWYREGAELLVRNQDNLSGFWKGVGHGESDPLVATSLSLLFLSKGRRPVLAAKIKHEPLDDWNHHRGDLANLTTYIESRWQRELTWQVIDSRAASPADLFEAPVAYISGELAPEFSDEEVRDLRAYIEQGGFIFAESCCGGDDFDKGFRALMERMFPEPEYELRQLPPEHPAYFAEQPVDPQHARLLYGVDIGCRTSVIYSPENLSCYWELARPGRNQKFAPEVQAQIDAALAIGINVMAYATNREVKYKLDVPRMVEAGEEADTFERARLSIAKLRHSGGWNAAPGALANLMRVVAREAGVRVSTDQPELSLDDDALFAYHMLFMHGRNAFSLTADQRQRLRTYVERGGVLFADAICGSDAFAGSFRREMAAIFPEQPLEPIPASHPMFTAQLGGFELETVGRRDPRRRGEGGPIEAAVRQVPPELDGIKLGGRYGVIFSPYDLSCALERHESIECPGYTREDAARIGLNVVLYSLHQ